jgi:hypothetical protein
VVFPAIANAMLPRVRETGPDYCVDFETDDLPSLGASVPDPFTDVPDPFTDADSLEELEEEVVTLAAHIHSATHRLLTLIAEFDRRRGWELGGHRSCAHWLSFRTGIDLGAAREKVRAARVLEALPRIGASMARGELSFSKIRALTRVATPENEGELVELARGSTAAQLERMVRAFSVASREEEADLDRIRHERRSFSVFPDDDGMYRVKGRLPAEVGALLMRAVEAASDALFRAEMDGRVGGGRADTESENAATQRRADALGLLAERALVAGFERGPISGTRAARYQVVLHVGPETLKTEGGLGHSEMEDGTHVSAETSRRISCDAGLVRVTHGSEGSASRIPDGATPALNPTGRSSSSSILDVGRKTRTIPPSLRRALEVRDRGCRFPGCGSRFTDAHHVRHWADGGETSMENCVLLCHHHHRLVHEGGWKVDWWGQGRPVFLDPRGGTHFEGRWERPVSEKKGSKGSVETLIQDNQARGVIPNAWTPSAKWKREWDIPAELMWRAEEVTAPDPSEHRRKKNGDGEWGPGAPTQPGGRPSRTPCWSPSRTLDTSRPGSP